MISNPWFSVLMLVLAVLGFVSVFVVYFKTKKVRQPCFAVLSYNIFTDVVSKVESLEVSYSGEHIENLTSTKVLFWNKGRETIRKDDIAPGDILKLKVKGDCRILDARILHVKNPANRFQIGFHSGKSVIGLRFDFVDKNEGVVIQLLHTGKSSKDIELMGTVMGAGRPVRKKVYPRSVPDFLAGTKSPFLYAALWELVGPILMLFFWIVMIVYSAQSPGEGFDSMIIVLFGVFVGVIFAMTLSTLTRRTPPEFEVFEEEF